MNNKTIDSGIYTPLYYDIAFDFRDIPKQADFLEEVFEKFAGRKLSSIIELGCGPAYFVREFGKRGKRSIGLDISPQMTEYAKMLLNRDGLKAEVITGDMLDFSLDSPVDMAVLMMDSISHILSPPDFIRHLKCVASNLSEGGIYLLECSHPSDNMAGDKRAQNSWKMERDGISVETYWGAPGDVEDHIRQTTMTTTTLKVRDYSGEKEIREVIPQRYYFYDEIWAYTELSGVSEIVEVFGDVNIGQPFDNSKKSWRMVPVLRKK